MDSSAAGREAETDGAVKENLGIKTKINIGGIHSNMMKNAMRKITMLVYIFISCATINIKLFAQDIYYVNRTEMLYRDYSPRYGNISELNEGEIITIISRFVGTDTKDVSRVEIKTESGGTGWLATDAISIKDSVTIPVEITENEWIYSYYLDVLRKGEKEYLFEYEPFWRDHFDKYKGEYYKSWTDLAHPNGMTIKNIFIKFYDLAFNFWNFINGKIEEENGTYQFFTTCIRERDFFEESVLNSYFNVSEKVKFGLKPDGDYLDVYINDKKMFTLIKEEKEIKRQFKNFMDDRYIYYYDLTNIVWPRRADGSMDYPPPLDMRGYKATHRVLESMRLHDAADASSKLVTTVAKGTEVRVMETGAEAVVDGKNISWVKIISSNGYSGWCSSEFLEEIKKPEPVEDTIRITNASEVQERITPNSVRTRGMPGWIWVTVTGLVVAAGGAAVLIIVKRKKRG
jgi:hypothetical protein